MPKIDKVFYLEITPEQFLEACSAEELQELDMLLYSPRFRDKLKSLLADDSKPDQVCKECGCSEYDPCVHPDFGSCWWVEVDLCSHCVECPGKSERPYSIEKSPE